MRSISVIMMVFSMLTGCPETPDVAVGYRVGGRVHGLWDGTDGVTLRLQANGVDAVFATSASGSFRFADLLGAGTSYTVSVMNDPAKHTCMIDAGGNGIVKDADVASVSVACTGPAVSIGLSGRWGWRFDATEETQTFAGSILLRDVALTISGSTLSSALVNGEVAALGTPMAPIELPVGQTTTSVTVMADGLSKTYQLVFSRGDLVPGQVAYGKASNTGAGDHFSAVALSGDTLAVGACNEASGAQGIGGDQRDDSAPSTGAVYVFVRDGTRWTQQAYLKASNAAHHDYFGCDVALSGNTLAVGAIGESSASRGIDGNQLDNTASNSGAVYVFVRDGTTWTQQAYIKASNADASDYFGSSVALDRDTLVVGAIRESSAMTGVDADQSNNSATYAGAVYVFVRDGATWTQQAYIKASNTHSFSLFGSSLAVSENTLAVGARFDFGDRNGNSGDDSSAFSGAVYVFERTGDTWTQQAYVKASNIGRDDFFGTSVALSGDLLAVGASGEDSAAMGIDGNQDDDSALDSGAVYVFVRSGATWTQQSYVKASNTRALDSFGDAIALHGDTLVVGATSEASAATGINGNQLDRSADFAGAVYAFVRTGATWAQQAYIKASNTDASDEFGTSIALSGDTLVIGARQEASAASGIDGNQADNTAPSAGAIYVFR